MDRKNYAALWRKLATLLGSGVPLVPSLVTLQLEHADTPLGHALGDVIERVTSGERFAEALAAHPDLFPRDIVQILRGGEGQGRLDDVAKVVGEQLEQGVLSCPGEARAGAGIPDAAPTAWSDEGAEGAGDRPPAGALGDLLRRALDEGASDVHLDATREGGAVRFRVDDVLQQRQPLGRKEFRLLVAQLKGAAHLDVCEARLPQDGRLRCTLDGEDIDVRVSTGPCNLGEAAVLRILRSRPLQDLVGRLERVFPDPSLREALQALTSLPAGLFIASGPTGSGKTTSLYALLGGRDAGRCKVVSVEDPVEVNLPGVHQVQVQPAIGLTFPAALRHLMRMDPDVLFCGEVRDAETAGLLLRIALTGHFVFTQLHASDALGCLQRLLDIGLEPYLVADAVVGILSQRLVRRLCPACRVPSPEHLERLAVFAGGQLPQGAAAFEPAGCPACSGTGFKGRQALYELLPMLPQVRSALHTAPAPGELERAARSGGFTTLAENATAMVFAGETSLTEVLRVIPSAVEGADL